MEQLGAWVGMAVYALYIIDQSVRGDQSLTRRERGNQGGGQGGGAQAVVGKTGGNGGHTSIVCCECHRRCSDTSSNTSSEERLSEIASPKLDTFCKTFLHLDAVIDEIIHQQNYNKIGFGSYQ